jgi:hypothetical protein
LGLNLGINNLKYGATMLLKDFYLTRKYVETKDSVVHYASNLVTRVPLAGSATNNYVKKITPYIISRKDNMTNQAVPEPQLLGQNQGRHQ